MVDSIGERSPELNNTVSHGKDSYNVGKTEEIRGGKLNNSAMLSTSRSDLAEGCEPSDCNAAVEGNTFVQLSEPTQNEPPGSRVDILA